MTSLKKGDKAPNFSGFDQDNKFHQLEDYAGKKLVVFFYPKADTPGCTAEACDLRDNFERFKANNYEVLGVSADSAKAQAKFKDKFKFPFPLLAFYDEMFRHRKECLPLLLGSCHLIFIGHSFDF